MRKERFGDFDEKTAKIYTSEESELLVIKRPS
jgi:hypothetical protein